MSLTEINEKASKSLPLVLGHDHYAGHVILLLAELFLREKEAQQVRALCSGPFLHLPLSLSNHPLSSGRVGSGPT